MYLNDLREKATEALLEIEKLKKSSGQDPDLDSLENQMTFIKEQSEQKLEPRASLGDNKFTFALISSKNLSAPEEKALKEAIDSITRIFLDKPYKA